MADTPQRRALKNYRTRLQMQGIARFEVLGLPRDRDLIRSLAKRLTQNDPEAQRIRSEVGRTISGSPRRQAGLVEILRLPRLEGLELEIDRPFETGRHLDF